MGLRDITWPVRSVVAGAAGTAAMSLAYGTERRLRNATSSLDYDDSLVPGEIVANVLRLPDVTGREEAELGMALRWGYGSAFGMWHGVCSAECFPNRGPHSSSEQPSCPRR